MIGIKKILVCMQEDSIILIAKFLQWIIIRFCTIKISHAIVVFAHAHYMQVVLFKCSIRHCSNSLYIDAAIDRG